MLFRSLDSKAWARPEIFSWLQREGGVAEAEMHRTFNCGIGFVLIVAAADVVGACAQLNSAGESAQVIGAIRARATGEAQTIVQ